MADRRRLPVLQTPPKPEEPERPPWHWIGFGTVAIFAAWLPLVLVASLVVRRVVAGTFGPDAAPAAIAEALARMSAGERARLVAAQALPHVAALAIAAFAGGFLVGRFGAGAGAKEAALAGAVTSTIAMLLSIRDGVSWMSLVVVAIAVAFAAWGGRVGAGRKEKRPPGTNAI